MVPLLSCQAEESGLAPTSGVFICLAADNACDGCF